MSGAPLALAAIAAVLHGAVALGALVLLPGLAQGVAALAAGAPRPSWDAPVQAWRRLARKTPLRLEGQSPVVPAAMAVAMASLGLAIFLMPSGSLLLPSLRFSDIVVVLGFPLLSRVAQAVALLESGVAQRAAPTRGALLLLLGAVPSIVLAALVLAMLGGGTDVRTMVAALPGSVAHHPAAPVALGLVSLGLWLLGAADLRQDADIAQAVPAESGRDLALWRLCAAARLTMWAMLIAMLLPPWPGGWHGGAGMTLLRLLAGTAAWAVKVTVVASTLQLWSQGPARRLTPAASSALAGLATLLGVVSLLVGETLA